MKTLFRSIIIITLSFLIGNIFYANDTAKHNSDDISIEENPFQENANKTSDKKRNADRYRHELYIKTGKITGTVIVIAILACAAGKLIRDHGGNGGFPPNPFNYFFQSKTDTQTLVKPQEIIQDPDDDGDNGGGGGSGSSSNFTSKTTLKHNTKPTNKKTIERDPSKHGRYDQGVFYAEDGSARYPQRGNVVYGPGHVEMTERVKKAIRWANMEEN